MTKAKITAISNYDGYHVYKERLIGLTGTTGRGKSNAGGWYTGEFTLDEESLCRMPKGFHADCFFYKVRLRRLT